MIQETSDPTKVTGIGNSQDGIKENAMWPCRGLEKYQFTQEQDKWRIQREPLLYTNLG